MSQNQDSKTDGRRHDYDPVEVEAFLRVRKLHLQLLLSYLELEHPVSKGDAEELAERLFNHIHAEDPERSQSDVGKEAWTRAYRSRDLVWKGARQDVLRMIGEQVRLLLILGDPTLKTWKYLVEKGPDVSDI